MPDQATTTDAPRSAVTADQITRLLATGNPTTLTTTRDAAADFIMPLVAAGLPVIPLYPNSKRPALLSNWQRTPVTTEAWGQWLTDAYSRGAGDGSAAVLGLGLRAGTRMLVADADTPDEVDALEQFFTARGLAAVGPTVTTPGTADRTHHSGGHWWFLLPADVAVPAGLPGVLSVDAAGRTGSAAQGPTFDLFLHSKQAALPPTRRDPGRYQLTGQVYDLPEPVAAWLREKGIAARVENTAAATRRAERAAARSAGEINPELDDWEDTHSWDDLLSSAGWTQTGVDAACGCTQWRHPQASSPKSATAHDCARGTYLHLWSSSNTDLEPGSYSKLFVDAALHHGGDYAAAARAAGMPPKTSPIETLDLAARMREIQEAEGETEDQDVEGVVVDAEKWPLGHPNDPRLLRSIFNHSDQLRALYHDARNRTKAISPVGLLLGEFVRVAETAGPEAGYILDGEKTPLSTYIVVASPTAVGKTAVQRTRPRMRRTGFGANLAENGTGVVRDTPASKEALVDMLLEDVPEMDDDGTPTGRKTTQKRTPAVATVRVDELANLVSNRSTAGGIVNELMTGWSGGDLGGTSRTHQTRKVTGPFVLNLTGGIQPARAGFLVGREATAAGLTSRLVFTAPDDPWLRGIWAGEGPDVVPAAGVDTLPAVPVGKIISWPATAEAELREDQLRGVEGTRAAEDGHALQARLRLACLAALWHGETEVSEALWAWAGALMEHSRRTRASVVVAAEAAAQEEATEQRTRDARARVSGEEAVQEDVRTAAALLYKNLPEGGAPKAWGTWKKTLGKPRRPSFDAAVNALVREGLVRTSDGGKHYERCPS